MTNDEMLKLFEGGYPQRASFIDYLTPDPNRAKIIAADRALNQFRGSETPESKTVLDYFGRDPIAPLLNRGVDPARVMPDTTVAPPADRVSMFNLSGLTDYIPSASTIGSYIPTSLPNVFGVNNPLYAGLLGEPQSQALSKQSNIAGLLGAAAALVQGMGRQGGRRSAAQNIISALGAGYGSAGQQYQQGLQMYGQTQQLALQQRQQAAIEAMKLKYPEYADEIAANPAGAFRLIAERETANKKGIVVDGNLVNPITGEVIFKGTKPQARILTADEVAERKLPTSGGQVYQMSADGKIEPVSGTLPTKENKPATSIEEFQFYQSQGGKKSYENFMKDKTPSTSVTVNTGELSKGTKGKLEETILSTGDAVTRLNDIQASYRPEYQTIQFKGAQQWSTLKDKFSTLKPNEQAQLSRFAQYRQNTTQNLNLTIKELTGAAMGEKEAERIISTLPNAGTSIFDGDSPTEFKSKLDNALQKTKWALARKNYSLRNNLEWKNIPLDSVPEIVNKRGKEIEKAYNLDPKDPATEKTVQRQLAAEFGISF
jgi:hypothetical protein